MKITPNTSLFQALSNLPRVSRDAVNLVPSQNTGAGSTNSANQATQIREAARQEAIRQNLEAIQNAQRQFRQQTNAGAQANTIQQTTVAAGIGPAQGLSPSKAGGVNSYSREAPGVDQRPSFVKLGQILDISV